jgi:hypothetical protein
MKWIHLAMAAVVTGAVAEIPEKEHWENPNGKVGF